MKYVMGGICVMYMLLCIAMAGLLGYRMGKPIAAFAPMEVSVTGPVRLSVPAYWHLDGIAEREE